MNINFEHVKTKEQIQILADTAKTVWHEAYKNIISLNQINYMIEKFQSFTSLVKAINKNKYIYYFVKDDNVIIGYIGLHEEDNKMFLSKLYILKKYRGKQVASKTFEERYLNCKQSLHLPPKP